MKDFIIIGAGLSGLNTADFIKKNSLGSVQVLEKSRGVGGRMATRRTLETKFDHGAQFYRLKPDSLSVHEKWKSANIPHLWFQDENGEHWCSNQGMTMLAKHLASDHEVLLDVQIENITYENYRYILTSTKLEKFECRQLILTAPLPQAVILLEKSKIDFPLDLKKISYSKALIALLTLKNDVVISPNGYSEFTIGPYFSISDQKHKKVSSIPALTVTMSAEFSESHFEEREEDVLAKIVDIFKLDYPEVQVTCMELKKWRYCQVHSSYGQLYADLGNNLFLAGDAFGGASLLGALRSSQALGEFLLTKSP